MFRHKVAAAENKMQNCATFELRFDSQLDMTFESSAVYAKLRTHARAKVAVRLNIVGYERPDDEMTAPLEYALYAAEIKPAVKGVSCKPTGAQPEPGTHKLAVFHPYLNWTPARNKLMPADIAVALSLTPMPGGKLEEVTVCSSAIGKDVLTLFHNWFFPGGFRDMHKDEMTGSGLLITDWQRGDATVFMRKTYDRSGTCVTLKCVEKTTLELIHKPR